MRISKNPLYNIGYTHDRIIKKGIEPMIKLGIPNGTNWFNLAVPPPRGEYPLGRD
jgi:hypothetical protein